MKDRRATPRQRSLLQGRLLFNNRRSSVDCVVRDISEQGAKLKFSEAVAVPDVMELFIPSKDETFRARIQWRIGDEIGVEFGDAAIKPTDALSSAGDLHSRVAHLETEVATLRRKVHELLNEQRRRSREGV